MAVSVLPAFRSVVRYPLDGRIANNEQEITTLVKIRDTLLPKLISDEIQTKDAETLVEKAL